MTVPIHNAKTGDDRYTGVDVELFDYMADRMVKAAEVMTLAFVKTMETPGVIRAARKGLLIKNGGKYNCPLHDYVKPPIG